MEKMEFDKELILLNQEFDNAEEAIRASGQVLLDNEYIEPEYIEGMLERDRDLSTYMGNFLAIPHGTHDSRKYVKKTGISFIQVPKGVNFIKEGEPKEVKAIFSIASQGDEHLELLQQIAIFASDVDNIEKLTQVTTKEEVIELLSE